VKKNKYISSMKGKLTWVEYVNIDF